jgi:hypothetical protein
MKIFGFSPTSPNKGSTGEPLRVTPGGPHASPNGISTIDYNGIKIYVRKANKNSISGMITRIKNRPKSSFTTSETQTNKHASSSTTSETQTNILIKNKNFIELNGQLYKKNNEIKKQNKTYKIKNITKKRIVLTGYRRI